MFLDILTPFISQLDTGTVLVFVVVALLTWTYFTNRNLPPGPWGLPVVGYVPFLDAKEPAEEQLHDLCKKYGPIMSMQLGSYLTIILDDYASIKEAFVKQGDIFADRPDGVVMKIQEGDVGVINTNGERWREVRRFALSTLRDYGMGKLSLEPKIIEEIHFFLHEVAKQKGQAFDFSSILGMSTANIISALEFGKRYNYDDERFKHLRQLVDDVNNIFTQTSARGLFKWIKYIPFADRYTGQAIATRIQTQTKRFMHAHVEEHKRKYQDASKIDFIDAYITEQKTMIRKNGNAGYFDDEELIMTLQILFMAGTESTTSTMRWAFMLLMVYPEMQKKIHAEIDDVIGMERAPTMSDRTQTIYVDAFLHELQRYGNIAPVGVMHATAEETELNGYRIPKGTCILSNLWAVHNDSKMWKNPEKFMPERFINAKGKVEKPEYFIPFGAGKRACLGEALARNEIYLYFTSIMQRFTILPPDETPPTIHYESLTIRRPRPYKIRAVEREGYHVQY